MTKRLALIGTVSIVLLSTAPSAQQPGATAATDVVLAPTNHPRLPEDISQLWMAPDRGHSHTALMTEFASGVALEVDANYTKALPIFSQASLRQGPLAHYTEYYKGLAEMRTGRTADARQTFQSLQAGEPIGYLLEAAALREAECDEALADSHAAMQVYERLAAMKTTAPDDVLMRLGKAAKAAGESEKALSAFSRVYFEFPFSDLSALASDELDHLSNVPPITGGSTRYKLELGRAERLFAAKKYAQARSEFENVRRVADGDDKELVNIRLAECDYFLKRPRNARDEVKPYVAKASRQGEALYFYAVAERDLGEQAEYLSIVRRLVNEFSDQTWAEEALNNLATHYILQSDDEQADVVFREMYQKFPMGHYAERAAWKIGWWAYKNGRYAETVRAFESAAAHFPRSDYRPSWLYWSARAHDALKETDVAEARYRLVAIDYLNTYYGRLALTHLGETPQRKMKLDAHVSDAETGADAAAAGRPTATERARRARAARARAVRSGDRRTAFRPEGVGRLVGNSSDARLDLPRARRSARRHQRHEAGLSAVHGRGRREAPGGAPQGALPRELLAAHPAVFGGAPPRPVHDCRADRAGVDLHCRREIGRECIRSHAAPPVHGPALCPNRAQDEAVLDEPPDHRGAESEDGHRVFLRSREAVRRRPLRARQLQCRGEPRRALDI